MTPKPINVLFSPLSSPFSPLCLFTLFLCLSVHIQTCTSFHYHSLILPLFVTFLLDNYISSFCSSTLFVSPFACTPVHPAPALVHAMNASATFLVWVKWNTSKHLSLLPLDHPELFTGLYLCHISLRSAFISNHKWWNPDGPFTHPGMMGEMERRWSEASRSF